MSLSKCKADRRAALAGKQPERLPVHTFNAAHHVAAAAVGLKLYHAVVPNSPTQAHAPDPMGAVSVEYAKQDAIEPRNNPYDPKYNPTGRRRFDKVLKEVRASVGFSPICSA